MTGISSDNDWATICRSNGQCDARPIEKTKRVGTEKATRIGGLFLTHFRLPNLVSGAADAHAVEAAVDEDERNGEEDCRQDVGQSFALRCRQLNGEFDGQKAEQRRELDDWVERDGAGVLKRIADRVANDSGVVEWRALLFQLDFDDLLGVIPCATGVGHEDGLIEAEDRDREEITDKEERLDEGEGQRREEDGDEDVKHALLRVLGA